MRIIIRSLRDNPFFVEVEEQATVFSVKAAIFQMNGVFPSHQSIIYQGNVLPNETTILSLNFPMNKQASLYLVISKEQRERLKKERERMKSASSDFINDSPPRSNLFSTSSSPINQGFGIQNNTCFDSIMKNITDKSPNFSHALNDKEALYESYDAFRDPGKRLELLKSIDRTLNLVESKAGCYRDIIEHQRLVTEAVDDAIDKYMHEVNPTYFENLHKTVIPEKPLDEPSSEPIAIDLNHSESFLDGLLQRQLMLVMTLPNGAQKMVTVKKNTESLMKVMQLMMNLQAKAQMNKSSNEKSKPSCSNFFTNAFNTPAFNYQGNDIPSEDKETSNEEEDNSETENGMKQIEMENQMSLLKLLMMTILSDESNNNNENNNKDDSDNLFFNTGFNNSKDSNSFDEEDRSETYKNNPMFFDDWNNLFGSHKKTKNGQKNDDSQQPKYEQIFHRSEKPSSPKQLLVDIDSESESNSNSNFCINSYSSNSDYQSFVDDDDCFFTNDFFSKNNSNLSDSNGYAQPRNIGHPNTTYYSTTADSINNKEKVENDTKDISFDYNLEFINNDRAEDDNENYVEDQNEAEEKRREGWKIIYDLVNQNCENNNDDEQHYLKNNNEMENEDFQDKFNEDDSDISID